MVTIPVALHRAESDLPFIPYQEGVTFQLVQADIELTADLGQRRACGPALRHHLH